MTMADQIGSYIMAQLALIRLGQTITLFNGSTFAFRTDAGSLVQKQMEYTENPDAFPSLVFYTGKNTVQLSGSPDPELGMENRLQEFSIEGFIECAKDGGAGDWLKSDITVALRADPWWGGLIIDLQNIETESAIQVGDKVFAVVKFSAQALYTVPLCSPHARG